MKAITQPVIVWLRQDLRLTDNRAFAAAVATGQPIVPVVIVEPDGSRPWTPGAASRWWWHHSLQALDQQLRRRGSRLIVRRGEPLAAMDAMLTETGATTVFVTRVYEPLAAAQDQDLSSRLQQRGVAMRRYGGNLLLEPEALKTKAGDPFKVFTPFWRALVAAGGPKPPTPAPNVWASPKSWPQSDAIDAALPLPTKPDWAGGLRAHWTVGEDAALARLDSFLERAAPAYAEDRNRPDKPGTSRLSPHLHFGEISPAVCWHQAVRFRESQGGRADTGVETFLKELAWREFSYHLLTFWPDLPDTSFKPDFEQFPWRSKDPEGQGLLRAWQRGQTGYPIVDAGMRELWHTGWMHNRVRMIAASFLIKHLRLHWREGETWFWETLVDADLASNAASWQWVAGSGADAAPYFRIFNPVTQGEKFDPDGAYVKRWVPELANLPAPLIHAPWQAPPVILAAAGVTLGRTYPHPIVDHARAREQALAGFKAMRT